MSAVFLIFYAAVVLGTIVQKAYYKATAQILVNKGSSVVRSLIYNIGITGNISAVGGSADSTSDVYDTDELMVKNRSILEEIIRTFQLRTWGGEEMRYDKLVENYFVKLLFPSPHLKAEQKDDSNIMEVRGYSCDATQAAAIANMAADLFIRDQVRITQDEYHQARLLTEDRMKELRDRYHRSLSELRDYKIRNGYVQISIETENLLQKIETLKTNIENNQQDILDAQTKSEKARFEIRKVGKLREETVSYTLNTEIKNLRSKLSDIQLDIQAKSSEVTSKHPEYRRLEMQLAAVMRLLEEEKRNLMENSEKISSVDPLYDQLEKLILDTAVDIEVGKVRQSIMKKLLDAYKEMLLKIPDIEFGSTKLETDLESNRDAYQKLYGLLGQLELAEKMTLSHIRVADYAPVPYKPNWPKKPLNLIAGIFIGIFVSLVFSLIIDQMDTSIKTTEDVIRLENFAPVLGTVPYHRLGRRAVLFEYSLEGSVTLEPLRAIRNYLKQIRREFSVPGGILITSVHPGEGKSMLATNMAVLFAREGKRVLLVDLNLRNPILHQIFQTGADGGINGSYVESIPIDTRIVSTREPGLDFLPAGPDMGRIPDLIDSEWLPNTMRYLKSRYDLLVLDAPSISECTDPMVLGEMMEQVVLVVSYGRTPVALVEWAGSLMKNAQVPLTGIVVNRFPDSGLLFPVSSNGKGQLQPHSRKNDA